MRFTGSNLDPSIIRPLKCFVSGCALTQIHLDTDTHMAQAVTRSTFWRPRRHVHIRWLLHTRSETATWSLFSPLDGCNNIWASCQGRGYYGNDQTESPASLLHDWEGGTHAGKAERGHPVWGRSPVPLASSVGLGHCIFAGSLGLLVPLCLPRNLVSLPCVAFVSLHVFPSLANLSWLLGPGQTHPRVSIETADPGCEFLVLENPMWWL